MKSTVNTKTAKNLNKIISTIKKSSTLTALNNFKLQDGVLTYSNLETEVNVKTDLQGSCLVDARDFTKILSSMENAEVGIDENNQQCVIAQTNAKGKLEVFKLKTNDVEDYPRSIEYGFAESNKQITSIKNKDEAGEEEIIQVSEYLGTLNKEDISKIVLASNFMGSDELRPEMSQVFIQDGEIASTNAHYMYWDKVSLDSKHGVLIPMEAVKLLKDLQLEDEDFQVTLKYFNSEEVKNSLTSNLYYQYSSVLSFSNSIYEINVRMCVGRFPNYKAVIPKAENNTFEISLSKKDLQAFFTKATIVGNPTLKLRIGAGKIVASCENIDFDKKYLSELEGSITDKVTEDEAEPEIFRIGCNIKFLEKILKSTIEDKVDLYFQNPNKVIVINNSFLLMPVTLKD